MVGKMISQWIKFDAEGAPDRAIFTALKKAAGYQAGYNGPIQEGASQYTIAIAWESQAAHDTFKDSADFTKLLEDLKNLSGNDPVTYIVDFQNIIFWPALGPNTELRTVYFPANLTKAKKEKITNLQGLTMPHGLGIGRNLAHLSPYRKVPICGWIEDTQSYNDKDVTPCVWVNSWASKEKEQDFKERQRRQPEDVQDTGPLILDAWEKELNKLGALGWDDVHVDFELL